MRRPYGLVQRVDSLEDKLRRQMRTNRVTVLTLLLALTACAPPPAQPAPPAPKFSANLVINGDAETGPANPTASPPVSAVTGWTREPIEGTSENATLLTYAGYQQSYGIVIAGPEGSTLGNALFMGGVTLENSLSQTISLSSLKLTAGQPHTYQFSGLLGGTQAENDHVDVLLEGLDAGGQVTVSSKVSGPRALERHNVAQLLVRTLEGTLPANTTSVRLRLEFTREFGQLSESLADNLELRVKLD